MPLKKNTTSENNMFKKERPAAVAPFTPDGDIRTDGGVRYKITCDGGIDPSGVFWSKIVPAGSTVEEFKAAQEERDQKLAQLAALLAPTE
jgi:hypothetical protein